MYYDFPDNERDWYTVCSGPATAYFSRITTYSCPAGYIRRAGFTYDSPDPIVCINTTTAWITADSGYFLTDDDAENTAPTNCDVSRGNPCNPIGGGKYEQAVDYRAGNLHLTRWYSSQSADWKFWFESSLEVTPPAPIPWLQAQARSQLYGSPEDACTRGWADVQRRTPIENGVAQMTAGGCVVNVNGAPKRRVGIQPFGTSQAPQGPTMVARRADGRALRFAQQNGAWVALDAGSRLTLAQTAAGYELRLRNGAVERYNAAGLLTEVEERGSRLTLSRPTSSQLSITNEFGKSLLVTYAGAGQRVTLPDGTAIDYVRTAGKLTEIRYPNGDTEGFAYVSAGDQDLLAERTINTVPYASWTYDTTGRATSSEHAGGVERTTFDYFDGATKVTGPLGDVRFYEFNATSGEARLTRITDESGNVFESRTYNGAGFLNSRTDAGGATTEYVHDSLGHELSRTEAVGTPEEVTTQTQWHPTLSLPVRTTRGALTTDYEYDAVGRLLRKTETAGNTSRTWAYSYNAQGLMTAEDGPRTDATDQTLYGYDAQGNLTSVTNALGHVTNITSHDAHGRPTSLTDPNGLVIRFAYDARGRLAGRLVGTELTQFTYTAFGELATLTLPTGERLTYHYDAAQRLTAIDDGRGNQLTYTLDAAGNRTQERVLDGSGITLSERRRVFDALSRIAQELGAANQATVYDYDAMDNPIAITDPLQRTTQRAYDALQRLSEVTDPLGNVARYGYDSDDRVTRVTDQNGNTTHYEYDGFGNLVRQESPDTGVTTFAYDEAGNLTSRTNAKGQTTTFTYDALNRLTQTRFSDASTVTYVYDTAVNGKGRLSQVSEASILTRFDYYPQGRLALKRQTLGNKLLATRYVHDSAGRLSQMIYPSGASVTYTYDRGQLTTVSLNGTVKWSNITYRPFGGIVGWTQQSGQRYDRFFDSEDRLTAHTLGNSTAYLDYDLAGRLIALADDVQNASYGYDALNRLTSANDSAYSLGWDYDANGNRLQQTGTDASAYTYLTGTNRLSAIDSTAVYHDSTGNRIADNRHTYLYNVRGRLAAVDNGTTARYYYDAAGERVYKEAAGATPLFFAYDQAGHLIGEYTAQGTVQETFWLGDLPVGTLQNGSLYYIHPDHLGTPRAISDGSGRIVWRWESEPFGTAAANEDPDGDGNRFTYNLRLPGQYFDKETGLHYNYFRDYDPATARYIESDPIGLEGGLNTYTYVSANPVYSIDPFGLDQVNFHNPKDVSAFASKNIKNVPGICQVLAHGQPESIADNRTANKEDWGKKRLDAYALADELEKNGCTRDMPVVIYACNTGKGKNSLAEELSKVWAAPVKAPDSWLHIDGMGHAKPTLIPRVPPLDPWAGNWRTFGK